MTLTAMCCVSPSVPVRHGQGDHNLVMTNNDPDAWKAAYAEKNGAADPELTELGEAQAKASIFDAITTS